MKYALIGEKLGHSFSERIHSEIGFYDYEQKEIDKSDLDGFMKSRDFEGINVTIPYKSAVIPYLDTVDPIAEKTGVVNTIVNRCGRLFGYNTDFGGLKMLIEKQGFDYKNKKVLIFGSGATANTAFLVAESLGAKEIILVGRRLEVNFDNVHLLHSDADFIINTTPVGMYPDNFSFPIDLSSFVKLSGVTDVVYNPLETALCQRAKKRNISAESGLYMLVSQAVLAAELFSGKKLEVKNLSNEIYEKIIKEKQNIVLIGLPGCGKTTAGKALSLKTNREFVDTDEIITSRYGCISDIFAKKGEAYFRQIEKEVIKEVSIKNAAVISTGGGSVLDAANIEALKQNGVTVFLDRPVEKINPTGDRPLSDTREALKSLYEKRYGLYNLCADFTVKAEGDIVNTVEKILEIMK